MDFTYLSGGALETAKYPDNEVITYNYDGNTGLPTTASSSVSGGFEVDSTAYDYAGRMTLQKYGAGGDLSQSMWYSSSTGRMTTAMAGTDFVNWGWGRWDLINSGFSYDDNGNITRIVDYRNPPAANSGAQNLLLHLRQPPTA